MSCRRNDDVVNGAAFIKISNRMKGDGRSMQNEKLLRAISFHAPSETGGSDNCPDFHNDNLPEKNRPRIARITRLFRILSATLPFVPVARAWARAQAAAHVLGVPHAAHGAKFRRVFPRTC